MRKNLWTALVMTAAAAIVSAVPAAAADSDVISDGVYIGDQNVGGMTTKEAEQYVKNQVKALEDTTVTIQMGDQQSTKTLKELGLKWDNPDLVQEISQIGTTGNIIRRYKEQKSLQNENSHYEIEYTVDSSLEEAFVDSDPVEGSVYMGDDGQLYVEGGTDGLTLDADATLKDLQDAIGDWKDENITIEATVERESPQVTAETLSKMTDVLGTATTDYSASSAGRAQNVENGTSKINGTLLMPGESFSVTDAVVPFNAENGYELAPSYEAGQVVDSYGGGICQVSTTLYNAVLKAELEVDARSNHTMLVSYVDPSKDAAIAEGVMDFVFTNDKDSPIYIAGSAYYGTLTFTIFGEETRPANRSIEFVSEVLSQTDPATNIKLVAKTDQNVGYFAQVQTPHQGMSAVLWKKIYIDGVLTDTVQVNSSTYQASPAIYEVGIVTGNQALSSALNTAIANNDLTQVQNLLANGVPQQTETQAPQTDAPQTDAPQTDASQMVDPPETDAATSSGEDVQIIQ